MNNTLSYIIELILCSSILYLGYLLIRNRLSPGINRILILLTIILPLALPVIEFQTSQKKLVIHPARSISEMMETKPIADSPTNKTESKPLQLNSTTNPPSVPSTINWWTYVGIGYLVISLLLFARCLKSMVSIFRMKNRSTYHQGSPDYWVTNHPDIIGASFFRWIFIGKDYSNAETLSQILHHEQIHQKQLHSLDIMLAEICSIIFWINPVIWMIRKEMRNVHEYETDAIVASHHGSANYSRLLLNLASGKHGFSPLNLFSAHRTTRRIRQLMDSKPRNTYFSAILLPFLIIATWLVSCESDIPDFTHAELEMAMSDVKTITTTYTSHQSDTKQKDGGIIAVAYFLPDGQVDRVEQHMTYPYDFERPFKVSFFAQPKSTGIPHILDGLESGPIEKNLLYGNDWPKVYANVARKDHPKYQNSEFSYYETSVEEAGGLPKSITVTENFRGERWDQIVEERGIENIPNYRVKYKESFKYDDGKITEYNWGTSRPKNMVVKDPNKISIHAKHEYFYKEDKVSQVKIEGWNHKFYYENDVLVKAEYFKGEKLYAYREFFYNDDGLKTRTDMYNLYGDLEYTIDYEYEFYE